MRKVSAIVICLSLLCAIDLLASKPNNQDTSWFVPYWKKGHIVRYSCNERESRIDLSIGPAKNFDIGEFDASTALHMYNFGTVSYHGDTLVLVTSRNPSKAAIFKGKVFMDIETVLLLKVGDKLMILRGIVPRAGDKHWLKP